MNKPLKSIARISVVDQAIQNLQNYITDNNLQPGDKLPTEKEVCEMMGIGPVSYTHLDVYKRQSLRSSMLTPLSVSFSVARI